MRIQKAVSQRDISQCMSTATYNTHSRSQNCTKTKKHFAGLQDDIIINLYLSLNEESPVGYSVKS